MREFKGEAAWVTGGGSGIGRALALELARRGADVAISGRTEVRLEEVAREVEALGRRSLAVRCDVTDEGQVAAAADRVAREFGKLDLAIANAGYAVMGPVEGLTVDEWRKQLDVNVIGSAMTAKHALAYLRKTKGRLGLVGSIAAFVPLAKHAPYCASKYAVRALGQTISVELAGTGVSCTTMHPGFVESEIARVDNEGVHHPDRKDGRPKKLMWPADKAARVMLDSMHRRQKEFVFTGHGKVGAFFGKHAPGLVMYAQARQRRRR